MNTKRKFTALKTSPWLSLEKNNFPWLRISALVLAATVCYATNNQAPQATAVRSTRAVPNQILVKPAARVSEASVQSIFAAHGAVEVQKIAPINVRVLRVPEQRLDTVLEALSHNPKIEFAETDAVLAPALTPNDPYYSMEWHLAKIQAPLAWDVTTGSETVTIAILDSGINSAHPDLAGLVVPGWNFYDNTADTTDVTGHGTAVAGQACTLGNNGIGIAALAWGCKIMPLRVADPNGYTSDSLIAAGLTYAADHGARVANASFSISGVSSTLSSAAQYFQSKGGVFTGSAGNEGAFDSSPDDPYVLRVSATDQNDLIASFSSTGNSLDLCAPGVSIVTTTKSGGYGYGTGTSASAPIVAGVAALMISANPALTGPQVQDILKQTADDLGTPGWDSTYGWGRVNAYKAVQAALNASAETDRTIPTCAIAAPASGTTLAGTVTVTVNASDNVGVTRVELSFNGTVVATSTTAPANFTWNTTQYGDGSYVLQAKAYDAAGNVGPSTTVSVTVQNSVPDTTAPTVQVLSPVSGSTVSGTLTVNVSASDNVGVTKVEWYLNGALIGSNSGGSAAFTWNTTTSANGTYILQARAYDAAGNVGTSANVSVTVQNAVPDTTPPAVRIASPVGGTKITAKTTPVSVTASDNVAVASVDLLVDGKKYATSTSSTPTFSWNTGKLRAGTHTLQSVAYDRAGNSARSAVVSVTK